LISASDGIVSTNARYRPCSTVRACATLPSGMPILRATSSGFGIGESLHRIDEDLVDLLGRGRRDVLDVHAAFRACHQRDALRAAVDHHCRRRAPS
jgi:hypothetical protein